MTARSPVAPRVRPVSRLRVLAAALALLAALAGVVALTQYLRHPPTVTPITEPYDPGDPRDGLDCPSTEVSSDPDTPLDVSSNDLYECPQVFDGHTVRYEGEVVGAVLRRADGAWVQLNDDAYAGDLGPLPAHREFRGGNSGVGVHLPEGVASQIESIGGPASTGDVLAVTGVSHQSDPHSGEAAIIRASGATVVARGVPISHDALPDRRIAGVILALLAAGSVFAGRVVARRRR